MHTAPTYPFTMWRWRLYDDVTKRRITTSYLMTEADALAKDPTAEKVPGTERVISGPSTDFGAWMPKK